jgi:hypothetical protein
MEKNIKIKYYFWIIIYILNVSLGLQAQERAANSVVEVQGLGKDADTALKNAIFQAVEQAVGAYVDQETVIKNEEIIQDKLLSVAQGFVERYDVIMEPRQRRDGSGIWEIKIKAVVKKSDVGAALRTNGVIQVKADGSAGWAQQVTKLKNREDAMQLLENLLPQITKNLVCGRIVQSDDIKMHEDPKTGELMVETQIEYDINIEWWNKEAFPALDASLTSLSLRDKPPVVKELNSESGGADYRRIIEIIDNYPNQKYTSIKVFTPKNTTRTSWILKEYFIPTDWHDKFVKLCENNIAVRGRHVELFTLEFCDNNGLRILSLPLNSNGDYYTRPITIPESGWPKKNNFTTCPAVKETSPDTIDIIPQFFSRDNVFYNYDKRSYCLAYDYTTEPILGIHYFKIDHEILKNTKSLKLVPGYFGVTEKNLRVNHGLVDLTKIEKSSSIALKDQKEIKRTEKNQNIEYLKSELEKILIKMDADRITYRKNLDTINRLTNYKRTPVQQGSNAYYQCLEASKIIVRIDENAPRMISEKNRIEAMIKELEK